MCSDTTKQISKIHEKNSKGGKTKNWQETFSNINRKRRTNNTAKEIIQQKQTLSSSQTKQETR